MLLGILMFCHFTPPMGTFNQQKVLWYSKYRSYPNDRVNGDILFPAFYAGQVCMVHSSYFSKLLLAQTEYFSVATDIVPDDFSCIQSK